MINRYIFQNTLIQFDSHSTTNPYPSYIPLKLKKNN